MAEPVVRSSSMLWSQIVAQARASDQLDYAAPGQDGIAQLTAKKDVSYEFGGWRRFYEKTNPYE